MFLLVAAVAVAAAARYLAAPLLPQLPHRPFYLDRPTTLWAIQLLAMPLIQIPHSLLGSLKTASRQQPLLVQALLFHSCLVQSPPLTSQLTLASVSQHLPQRHLLQVCLSIRKVTIEETRFPNKNCMENSQTVLKYAKAEFTDYLWDDDAFW